jgi:hypothetical protein
VNVEGRAERLSDRHTVVAAASGCSRKRKQHPVEPGERDPANDAVLSTGGKRAHRADMTTLAENFAATHMLRAGQDVNWAIDTLYVLVGPETWHLVRAELQRDEATYREWLLANLTESFG